MKKKLFSLVIVKKFFLVMSSLCMISKDDFDLLVGVNALAYTNFILNNKTVRKQYIKKIALT